MSNRIFKIHTYYTAKSNKTSTYLVPLYIKSGMAVSIRERGRLPKFDSTENAILRLLIKNKDVMGFNQIHRELGGTLSKHTVSINLKLLLSQNKIQKTKNGKYKLRAGKDFVKNVENLEKLLKSLDKIIPDLKPREKAYIGLYIWTVIFQEQTHPGLEFWTSNFIPISNKPPRGKYNKTLEEFFLSRNQNSIFLDELYRLFFDFCREFNPKVLNEVMLDVITNRSQNLNSKNKNHAELSKLLHKEIFIQRSDYETYYGTALCNAILDVKHESLTIDFVKKIKELKLSDESFDKRIIE
ncbi:hypothetical protein SCCGRSA3_01040 [Marine Group I thaumarchaeote SCGC RSA3]|uniref:Uncharacterized protein n=2 Tax=Marine Group I TaxID=905826 RepID=A0A087RT50_9ARCH|nr:hypothetical protein AAA799D11_00597 [Marine Group I thaumarchaeote SCGC AAA799-D11]KFM18707.1 hypothetical protein SCCGRSA3_01040 [Marine Group I thaumarchaeote SCGC RSA3]